MSLLEPAADRLDDLAREIREEIREGKTAANMALNAQLAIGRALSEARGLLTSDQEYGAWFASCEFGFSTEWGRQLRVAAGNEDAIRRAVATQVATGEAPNLRKAIESVTKRTAIPARAKKVESVEDRAASGAPEDVQEAESPAPAHETPDPGSADGHPTVDPAGEQSRPRLSPAAHSHPEPVDAPSHPAAEAGSGYGNKKKSKPAHKIPYANAADSLISAVRSIDALVRDNHNGGDVVDFIATHKRDDIDRLEGELRQALAFVHYALNVIDQKKRDAA